MSNETKPQDKLRLPNAPELKLMSGRILLEVIPEAKEIEDMEGRQEGSIFIPKTTAPITEAAKKKKELEPLTAIVVAVAADVDQAEDENEKLELGDVVMISKYAGSGFTLYGIDYTVVRPADILGVWYNVKPE